MMSSAVLLVAISVITTGLVLGVIFSLVAAGVTIVYGSIWLPNAANGQFFLSAALICWSFATWLAMPIWAAALLTLLVSLPISMNSCLELRGVHFY